MNDLPAPGLNIQRAYLGIGGNQGQRLDHLRGAVYALDDHPGVQLVAVSGIFETEYVGPGRQDPYLNACLAIDTTLGPLELLNFLKSIEQRHGRQPDGHMKPRPVDLDILLYGDHIHNHSGLEIPHPRLPERAFVLEPLAQIAPGAIIPDLGETAEELCAKIRQKSGVWLKEDPKRSLLPAGCAVNKEEWRAALAVYCR